MTERRRLHADARAIFEGAPRGCDIADAMDRHLRFEGRALVRATSSVSLEGCDEFLVIALGKAAVPMARALLQRLPTDVMVRGVCSGAAVPADGDARVKWFAGGHPLPNAESFAAASEALRLLRGAGARTFVFFLVSGGGSAMMELPRDPAISLEEALDFHRALVGSGATIAEINTVRKRFSAVKGGRLAMAAPQARQLTLMVADVPLNSVEAVASSPTLPDTTTDRECLEILERFELMRRFPARVREWFEHLCEKPAFRQGEFHADYEVLLSNENLLEAARKQAEALGYRAVVDNECDEWDYREACTYLLGRFRELQREYPRVCLIAGGEVTVRLEGETGRGGRNQHFALRAAIEMAHAADESMVVLSAGSDGVDGNSDAAGAIVDTTTIARARSMGIDAEAALADFDSGRVFATLEDSIVTGPTGTNLRDLRVLLGTGRGGRSLILPLTR